MGKSKNIFAGVGLLFLGELLKEFSFHLRAKLLYPDDKGKREK